MACIVRPPRRADSAGPPRVRFRSSRPSDRIVLDFERALELGLEAMADDMRRRIRELNVTDVHSAEKVYFWRAAIRSIEGVLHWCARYATKVSAHPPCRSVGTARFFPARRPLPSPLPASCPTARIAVPPPACLLP